jgi:glycine oxidase
VDESAEGAWLQTEHGMTMSADKIVVAAGLNTRRPLVDVELDWIPYKGEMGVFAGVEAPSVALNYRGYIAPWNDHQVLLGVLNTRPPFEDGVRDGLAGELLAQMSEVWTVDTTEARMVDSWSGIRPALSNHKPRLGPISSNERVFICTGHGGRGLLTAPLSAVALCDRMEEKSASVPNSWLLNA